MHDFNSSLAIYWASAGDSSDQMREANQNPLCFGLIIHEDCVVIDKTSHGRSGLFNVGQQASEKR